jgi:predicted molibdopterin-dependent oxidoreductase YjgC
MKGFERIRVDNHVCISRRTAKKLNVKDGTEVKIIGREVDLRLPVKITDDVPEGSVLIFYHHSMGVFRSQPVRIECT